MKTAMTDQEKTTVAPDSAMNPGTPTAVANFIRFLETGVAPRGLFAQDLFSDVMLPHWRIQAETAEGLLAIRKENHPWPGRVRAARVENTEHGFTMEFEERWHNQGQEWYAREMALAEIDGDTITELAIYCTGDWDEARQREHAAAIHIVRP